MPVLRTQVVISGDHTHPTEIMDSTQHANALKRHIPMMKYDEVRNFIIHKLHLKDYIDI